MLRGEGNVSDDLYNQELCQAVFFCLDFHVVKISKSTCPLCGQCTHD
jgi:hypothetical protein